MLEARKNVWFEKTFAIYNRNLFKRRFHSLRVAGLNHFRERAAEKPLIIYANHSSWWDGLVAFEIARAARLDSFLMMEEKQLKNLFPFRLLGAFSVVRENPREAVKSINYAVNLLREKKSRALWIFPQGEILPSDARPMKFYNGASRIIEKLGGCSALPVAIRYEFTGTFKPEIFIKIGEPEVFGAGKNFNSKIATGKFELSLTKTLDELKTEILNNNLRSYNKIV